MKMSKKLMSALLAVMLILLTSACSGQAPVPSGGSSPTENTAQSAPQSVNYPTKPIHIITHSEPGGGVDLFIRALQPYIQQELGQPIAIENVPGAAGRIGTTQVWNSAPDGYTLLSHSMPLTTVGDVVYDAEYNILEFEHLFAFDKAPYVIIVKKDSPINSFEDLIERCKTGKMTNSTSGIGGAMHFQSVIMKDALGVDYEDIPFDGSNPSMLAVMSGDVDFSIINYDIPLNNLDQVKVIVALNDERLEQYPDVPTTHELGYDFTMLSVRRCIVAPPGTPKEICDKLIDAFSKAAQNPDFLKWAEERGVNLDPKSGQDYYDLSKEAYDMVEKYKDILKK